MTVATMKMLVFSAVACVSSRFTHVFKLDTVIECLPFLCAVICRNGDLRVVGGLAQNEGRVELCWNETWGTICDGRWSLDDAKVACWQLGLSRLSKLQLGLQPCPWSPSHIVYMYNLPIYIRKSA